MANAIDRLFDEVATRLANRPERVDDAQIDAAPDPEPALLLEDPDAQVYTTDEWDDLRGVSDRLTERRVIDLGGLPEEERNLIAGGIRHRGLEALAFYKSRRYLSQPPFPGRWGIFYLRQGLQYVAAEVQAYYPGHKDPRKLGREFLRQHERVHLEADLHTLMLEAVRDQRFYGSVRRVFRKHQSRFVEEALANRRAWEWARTRSVGLEEFAEDFMDCQPNAYARYRETWLDLAAEWSANTLDGAFLPSSRRDDVASWCDSVPARLLRDSLCPEYVVEPSFLSHWINPVLRMPEVKEVVDSRKVEDLLARRYQTVRDLWERTKTKLKESPAARGLNFKPWDSRLGLWSVRVNDNFRAHLQHGSAGRWNTVEFGPHTKLGHG